LNLIRTIPAEEEVNVPNIQIRQAALAFSGQTIFSDINIDLPAGLWLSLLGPSGIGKSSLLRMIAGLRLKEEHTTGTVAADNHLPVHKQIAYMAQTDLLLPWLSVLDNATLGLRLRYHAHATQTSEIEKAHSLLTKVGLSHCLHQYPHQLSGGMRQRVALVRTLLENKPIVLMDEPFSALDAITRYKLQALAVDLLQHKTVFFITHDPTEALRLANRIYIMHGRPATLKHVTELSSQTPRTLTDPDVIRLQALLYDELSITTEDSL
jgi:putative hydroxymethylpyrimidine transport system ATP-binding protein